MGATDFYQFWCGWVGHGTVCPTHHYCECKETHGCWSSHTTHEIKEKFVDWTKQFDFGFMGLTNKGNRK